MCDQKKFNIFAVQKRMLGSNIIFVVVFAYICISRSISLPMTRMRICVQSSDPSRLQSQCVYCNNRWFKPTVRSCTGSPYLPATLSVEEAFCMVKNCRNQMPSMKPEPYWNSNSLQQSPSSSVNAVNVDDDYAESEALYAEGNNGSVGPANGHAVNGVGNGANANGVKRRPPASMTVGQPLRPQNSFMRPFNIFGKRSVDYLEKDATFEQINITYTAKAF